MKEFLDWLKKWWWFVTIIFTLLGGLYKSVDAYVTMRNKVAELQETMKVQLAKQLTEKDIIILIQLMNQNQQQNINYLTKILEKR